jgi:hypothetical protein
MKGLLIFLFGGLVLNLQHAKVIVNKVEVRCKVDILNGSLTYVNTKLGASLNTTMDIKQKLETVAVIFNTSNVFHAKI